MNLTDPQKIALGKTHQELAKDIQRIAPAFDEMITAILLEAAHRLERFANLEKSVQQAFDEGRKYEKDIEAGQ